MIQLLVYGSLLNPESASFGLNRKISPEDYFDVELFGYELAFDVLEDVVVGKDQMKVCFLNLRKNERGKVRAKSLRLSRQELDVLHQREKNYDQVDLSSCALPRPDGELIAFLGKKEHLLAPGLQPAILELYVEKVKNALPHFSKSFAEEFGRQLDDSTMGARVVSGSYQFISSEQNKLSGYGDA